MHLCQPCLPEFENPPPVPPVQPMPWTGSCDPHRRDARERRLAQRRPCPGRWCEGQALPSDLRIRLCERCAYKDRLCQHCTKPTISEAEREIAKAAAEVVEADIDLFTILFKIYGYVDAHALLTAHAPLMGDHAQIVLAMSASELDHRIPKRERLRAIFGLHRHSGVAGIRCRDCRPPPRHTPVLSKARDCGHWTAGANMIWCHFCAAEKGRCVSCVPTAPSSEESGN